MKETIKKPDYWSRSATDLLTACIWYLRAEHPHICDLPHVLAMITSPSKPLLETLQKNPQTAQKTIGLFDAMERGSDNQLSGVLGTLQSAISQINTPEICYIFGGDDFSLDLNNPSNPSILTVGSYPTLTGTFAPLCSLVITVAYGRIAYSKTAETLSKQFGKSDRFYVAKSSNSKIIDLGSRGKSQAIQERERIKPNEFLNFDTGRFVGVAVESNIKEFDLNFKMEKRPPVQALKPKIHLSDMDEYYSQVRQDINTIIH